MSAESGQADAWNLTYAAFDPDEEPRREVLCALGNGYVVTRACAEEASAGGGHYPGTYLAGGYDRAETEIAGRFVENEDLVNWPNWLPLTFRAEGGPWLDLAAVEIEAFAQRLDLARGLLEREVVFQTLRDRRWHLRSRRLVHMENPHVAALAWDLVCENWSGPIEIRSRLDGGVVNAGVARYRDLEGRHLEVTEKHRGGEDIVALVARTRQSRVRMAQAARTRLFQDGSLAAVERTPEEDEERIGQVIRLEAERGRTLRVEKVVGIHTSRDHAISESAHAALLTARRADDFDGLADSHAGAWKRLWNRCDLSLRHGDEEHPDPQQVLRLHVFHLLQTASPNTVDRDVGVPARGWHGEAYRGHILWDELFIFPFLDFRLPALTRELLMYRYWRLPEARHAAKEAGHAGAMYPWQSGSSGREESQVVHLNPASGRWIPDDTHLQRHVGAAIAWNVWHYQQVSGDFDFLHTYGIEMILEIACFLAGLAEWDGDLERYVIRGVVGPDEFHTRYPDADEPGLDNNAYTNVMTSWTLECARQALEALPEHRRREVLEKLEIDEDVLRRWRDVSQKLHVPFLEEGIIAQFDGYEALEELDWDAYRERYDDIRRLDRILEAEDDAVDRYKASKQADVLMLFFLFSTEELVDLFDHLGIEFDPDWVPRNIRYYLDRTSDGSSLSRMVHAWVLARSDREGSWRDFRRALLADLEDVQGGTTPEGIHLGAMAGTVDLVQRGYTGLEVRDGLLRLNPRLPEDLLCLRLRLCFQGSWLQLDVDHDRLRVRLEPGGDERLPLLVRGAEKELVRGTWLEVGLEPKSAARG